jgi:iron complex outermembrane receptor protein
VVAGKRCPINNFRAFGTSHGTFGGYVDVGRTFGTIGIRANALASDLETGVRRIGGKRWFASAAVDWKPSDSFDLQLDGEYIYKTITEPTTLRPITTPAGLKLPTLLPLNSNIGSKWFKSPAREYNLMARAEYRLSPAWAFTATAGLSDLTRERRFSDFRITNEATGAGTLTVELANDNAYRNTFYRGELAGTFDTGPLRHEVIAGVARNTRDAINPRTPTVRFDNNYFNPVVVPETLDSKARPGASHQDAESRRSSPERRIGLGAAAAPPLGGGRSRLLGRDRPPRYDLCGAAPRLRISAVEPRERRAAGVHRDDR